MNEFTRTLNYTASNEDGLSELRALFLSPRDTLVCITGSGSRTLDLLTAGPRRIYSVDMNPCQGFLLELKIAAIRSLSYDECMRFLGVQNDPCRLRFYPQLRGQLSVPARAYWDGKLSVISRGVLYQGRWERYFYCLAAFLRRTRGCLLNALFRADDLDQQRALFQKEWDGPFWRGFMRSISSKAVWRYAFGDPGFSKYVRDDFSVSRFLLERFSVSFGTRLLRESPFMNLLLQGRYSPEAGLPLHLRRDQYRILRERSDRITIVTDMLDSFLRSQHAGTIDAFSLSDFGSYVSSDQYRDVWTSIVTAGAPAARFCERQFLVRRPLPEAVARRVRRDSKLESSLEASDDSTFYSFVAGNLAWG